MDRRTVSLTAKPNSINSPGLTRVRISPARWWRFVFRGLAMGAVVAVGIFLTKSPPDATWVKTGDYLFVQVNANGSLRIAPLDAESRAAHRDSYADVGWLGIEIRELSAMTEYVRARLSKSETIRVRLDRRRLNEFGRLEAYFYHDNELLNAELVQRRLAKEATHPSDFAGIARKIRHAESH